MTNRALIDYCNMDKYDCIDCPYNHKECDQFIKEVGYSPWNYTGNDDEFLSREIGETEQEDEDKIIARIKDIPIMLVPSADLVEVVRCKDCKHKGESDDGYPMCMLFQKTKVFVELGHYCSRGERKEMK